MVCIFCVGNCFSFVMIVSYSVATIMEIILWDFLMFYQIFLSQVKRGAIISNKQGVYELPHELPDNLKKNQENLETC